MPVAPYRSENLNLGFLLYLLATYDDASLPYSLPNVGHPMSNIFVDSF